MRDQISQAFLFLARGGRERARDTMTRMIMPMKPRSRLCSSVWNFTWINATTAATIAGQRCRCNTRKEHGRCEVACRKTVQIRFHLCSICGEKKYLPFTAALELFVRRLTKTLGAFVNFLHDLFSRFAGRAPGNGDQVLTFVCVHENGCFQ